MGITLQAVDKTHLELIHVRLDRGAFRKYLCRRPYAVGLNHKLMDNYLNYVGADDRVLMATQNKDRVVFAIDDRESHRQWQFALNQIEIRHERFILPGKDYVAKFVISSWELNRIINFVEPVGEYIRVSITRRWVRFTNHGYTGQAKVELWNNRKPRNPRDYVCIKTRRTLSIQYVASC